MTAHPIDRDGLYAVTLADEADGRDARLVPRTLLALLDALTRAEAQSEARRINADYWRARVKAVENVLDQSRDDTTLHTYPEQLNADIRRALGNDHPPSD